MSKNLFITGTGTDVGKTFVTALIVKKLRQYGLKSAYFKAAASGNERGADGNLIPSDSLFVKTVSGIEQPLETTCPYLYEKAVSPHLAAKIENNPLDLAKVVSAFDKLSAEYETLTVEGSGGIICPLRSDGEEIWLEDIIRALGLGCLIVADAGLGTINCVGLSVHYMKSRNIPVKGIIFNRYDPDDPMHRDNLATCERLTGVKVVATVKPDDENLDIAPETLLSLYD